MFWKYELLFLDQASSSSDPFKVLILQSLIPRASLPSSKSLSNLILASWNPPSQAKFIIKPYTDYNTLWVKHATYQKVESLRTASFSKLDNTVKNNSIFKTKYAEFSTKWWVLLHFHNPICAYNHPYNFQQKIRFSTSVNSHLPIPPLLDHKIILTIPTNTPFRYISAIFHLPKIYPKKYFLPQPFSHFRLRKGSRELGSLVMTDTALISPFFHKVYTVITELTITDSLSFRLKKLVYCRK